MAFPAPSKALHQRFLKAFWLSKNQKCTFSVYTKGLKQQIYSIRMPGLLVNQDCHSLIATSGSLL